MKYMIAMFGFLALLTYEQAEGALEPQGILEEPRRTLALIRSFCGEDGERIMKGFLNENDHKFKTGKWDLGVFMNAVNRAIEPDTNINKLPAILHRAAEAAERAGARMPRMDVDQVD